MRQSPVQQKLSGMNPQVLRIMHLMFTGTEAARGATKVDLVDAVLADYETDLVDSILRDNLKKANKTRLRAAVNILTGKHPNQRTNRDDLISTIIATYRSKLRN